MKTTKRSGWYYDTAKKRSRQMEHFYDNAQSVSICGSKPYHGSMQRVIDSPVKAIYVCRHCLRMRARADGR